MVGTNSASNANAGRLLPRAAWKTPQVIVSDLGDARANSIIPGGDGIDPIYPSYAYGS